MIKHGDTQHYAHNPGGLPPEVDAHNSSGEPNIDEYDEWVDGLIAYQDFIEGDLEWNREQLGKIQRV